LEPRASGDFNPVDTCDGGNILGSLAEDSFAIVINIGLKVIRDLHNLLPSTSWI
jgi:hypothetical protein